MENRTAAVTQRLVKSAHPNLDNLGASAGKGHLRSDRASSRVSTIPEDGITLYDRGLPPQYPPRVPDHNVIRIFPAPERSNSSKPLSSRSRSARLNSMTGSEASHGSVSLPSLSGTSSGRKSAYITTSKVSKSPRGHTAHGFQNSGLQSSYVSTVSDRSARDQESEATAATKKSNGSKNTSAQNSSIVTNTKSDGERQREDQKVYKKNRVLFHRLLNIHSQSASSAYTNPAPRPDPAVYRQKSYPWPSNSNKSSRSGGFKHLTTVHSAVAGMMIPTITTTMEK